jgi:hypothetical protein
MEHDHTPMLSGLVLNGSGAEINTSQYPAIGQNLLGTVPFGYLVTGSVLVAATDGYQDIGALWATGAIDGIDVGKQ